MAIAANSITQQTIQILPNAEQLFHKSGASGILLIHGFLGSPFEMKYLAKRFIDAGFTVSVPRLPGHGTTLEDMACYGRKDWISAARNAYLFLKQECNEISIVGLSMGGILAILLAAEFSPQKIVLISTPRRIPDRRAFFAPLVRPFMKIIHHKDEEKGLADPEARKIHVSYSDGVPVMGAWHLMWLIRKAMQTLPHVRTYALIIQSTSDTLIPQHSV
jgi:carboxylesterase